MADDKSKDLETGAEEAKDKPTQDSEEKQVSPLSCLLGAIVAGGIAYFFYHAAGVIAGIFAQNQIQSDNFIVMRMSAAVRTLVIGIFALGAGVFGMASLGLTGLGLQTIFAKKPEVS